MGMNKKGFQVIPRGQGGPHDQGNSGSPGRAPTNDERFHALEEFANEAMQIINNQGEGLKQMGGRLGEIMFKMGKLDEVVQLQRIALRVQRDRQNAFMRTLVELGTIDEEILQAGFDIVENRILPITSEGRVNGSVYVSRYNTPTEMPVPQGVNRT